MASFPAKKNTAFTFYVSLVSQANTKIMQVSPTLAAGDVRVAIDDGAPANLATLPVVDADFTKRVKVAMSAAEMNGDRISVIFSDAAGAEWCDLTLDIPTSVRQVDDLAFPTVSGRSLDVTATGEAGIDLDNTVGTLAKTTDITGFNDLSAAQVNAEVDAALDTAIPAVNTATSVNDILLDVTNARLLGTIAAGTHNAQSGDGFARLGAPAGASVSADIAVIEAQTDDIGVAGAGLTALGDVRIANLDATVSSRASAAALTTVQADTDDIQTRLPAALVGGRMDSNVSALNNVATGAARIARSTQGIVLGTVGVGSSTTSIVTSSLDPAAAVADQFKGRIVTFEQGAATVNLRGQSTDITASTAAGVLTVSALTTAPASGDIFVIS